MPGLCRLHPRLPRHARVPRRRGGVSVRDFAGLLLLADRGETAGARAASESLEAPKRPAHEASCVVATDGDDAEERRGHGARMAIDAAVIAI